MSEGTRSLVLPCRCVRQAGSRCCRWSPAGVLTLTDTKRPLGPATGTATNGGRSRCSCHRPLEARFAMPATASARLELVLPTQTSPSGFSKAARRPARTLLVSVSAKQPLVTT